MTTASLLHDTGEVQLFHRPGRSAFTVLMFGEAIMRGGTRRWWGESFADEYDFDTLAFAAPRGDRHSHAAMEPLLRIARETAKPRRLAFGLARGGFAALNFATTLGADAVLALSPLLPPAEIEPAPLPKLSCR